MNDVTSHELLQKIEADDRRFRVAQSIFMTLVALILFGVVVAQFVVIHNFQDQSAERAAGFKTLQEENKNLSQENKRLNEQSNKYILCIAKFFATTDRSSRTLDDLNKCSISASQETAVPQSSRPATINPSGPGLEPVENSPGNSGSGNGNGGSETPRRNFIQRNLLDPISRAVDGVRGIIGL